MASRIVREAVRRAAQQQRGFYGRADGVRPTAVLFLGAPGVGKGTYSAKCADYFGLEVITTGSLMMDEIIAESDIGHQVEESARRGAMMPDSPILRVVRNRIMKDHSEGVDRFVLDGFPRNLAQAQALDEVADVQLAVNLGLRREVLIQKCLGRRMCKMCGKTFNITDIHLPAENGLPEVHIPPYLPPMEACMAHLVVRPDDAAADIERRLQAYEERAMPVLRYYQERLKLVEFEITGGAEHTLPRLHALLRPYLEAVPLPCNSPASSGGAVTT